MIKTPTTASKKMIFENETVEELCLLFKRNRDFATFHLICDHLTNLMASIIRRSRYHRAVPFDDLISHLYSQVDRWALKWRPGEGKFYTYAATSTKHGCISCVAREANYRGRFQNLGDTPMDILGSVASNHHKMDDSQAIAKCLTLIETRWSEPNVQEAIRVILVSVLERRGETRGKDYDGKSVDHRRNLLNTLRLGYEMDLDEAKFLVDWTTGAIRGVLLDHFSSPLSQEDIMRLSGKYSFIPDLINTIGVKDTKKLMHIFAGVSIRFPTIQQMKRTSAAGNVINSLMQDPQSLIRTGIKLPGISAATVEDDTEQVLMLINSGLLEDRPLEIEGGDDRIHHLVAEQ